VNFEIKVFTLYPLTNFAPSSLQPLGKWDCVMLTPLSMKNTRNSSNNPKAYAYVNYSGEIFPRNRIGFQ